MTNQAKKNLEYTLSTHAIEGLYPSKEAFALCRATSEKRMTVDEAAAQLKAMYLAKKEAGYGRRV